MFLQVCLKTQTQQSRYVILWYAQENRSILKSRSGTDKGSHLDIALPVGGLGYQAGKILSHIVGLEFN